MDSPQLRVLVVESDVSSLYSLSNMIQSCGYSCGVCLCAMDAKHVVQKPDIVLISVELSDMSGLKLLEIVTTEMVDLPVIMMASDDNPTHYHAAKELGSWDYVIKPVNEEFVRKMSQHVGKSCTKRNKSLFFSVGCEEKPMKKGRLTWTKDLETVFEAVVKNIGIAKATPTKILVGMHELGFTVLTREHISSRLQKFKLSVKAASSNEAQGVESVDDNAHYFMTEKHEESQDHETASPSTQQVIVRDTVNESEVDRKSLSLFTFEELRDKDDECCDISGNQFLTELSNDLIGVNGLRQEPLIFEAHRNYEGYEPLKITKTISYTQESAILQLQDYDDYVISEFINPLMSSSCLNDVGL